MEKIII